MRPSIRSRVLNRVFIQFIAIDTHKSLTRYDRSPIRPPAKPYGAMVSRLKSRASIQWDSPTPKGRALSHGSTSLCDLDTPRSSEIDMTRFDNTEPIVRLGETRTHNARLAKSWNGKPGSPTFSFRRDNTLTLRYGTSVLPTPLDAANTFQNNSISLCETLPFAPPLGRGPSGHLPVPVSWPLQSVPFKRFPGSRVSDCNEYPQPFDIAEPQRCA